MNFLIAQNFVFSKLKFILTKGRGEFLSFRRIVNCLNLADFV
jgi:hypothetical protein